jgi:hypothetical protein
MTQSLATAVLLMFAATLGLGTRLVAQPEQITICHVPPGNEDEAHDITISERALPAHLSHGDPDVPCDVAFGASDVSLAVFAAMLGGWAIMRYRRTRRAEA